MHCSRRSFLGGLFALPWVAGAAVRSVFPAEVYRYLDPATEEVVARLTDPKFESFLPEPPSRAIPRRRNSLIYVSNRAGNWQVYRMDLSSLQSTQLSEAAELDTASVTLLGGDLEFCCWDGVQLVSGTVSGSRSRVLCEAKPDEVHSSSIAGAPDGSVLSYLTFEGNSSTIHEYSLRRSGMRILARLPFPAQGMAYHRDLSLLCREGERAIWVVDRRGGTRRLETPVGVVRGALWGPAGRIVYYLLDRSEGGELPAVRQFDLNTGKDALIGRTSRFANIDCNSDGSVFVGASTSKAAPHVILLLRSAKREFVLCEHRCSKPDMVAPVFSPRSEMVFFNSDRDGKRAIYMVDVDRLVGQSSS